MIVTWIITGVVLGLLTIHLISDMYINYFNKEVREKRKLGKHAAELDDFAKKLRSLSADDLKRLGWNVSNNVAQQETQIKKEFDKFDDDNKPSAPVTQWKPKI